MIRALPLHPDARRAGRGRCIQVRLDRANRSPLAPWLLTVVAVLSCSQIAGAELPEVEARPWARERRLVVPRQPVGPSALDGGRYVGSALSPARSLRIAGSLGYGYTESVLSDGDRHHRLAGELYGALVVHPALQLSLGSEARVDRHRGDVDGKDSGLLVGSQITTRHAVQVHPRFSIAAQPRVTFPGASSLRRGLRSSSFDLSGLASYELRPSAQLGLSLGYRIDRSENAVDDPRALSGADRLAASINSRNATLIGALFSYSAAPFTALLEWSWDLATRGPVAGIESPIRVRAAVQRLLGQRFLSGVELSLDTSARPPFDELVRIEPRVWGRLSLSVLLDRLPPARPAVQLAPPAPKRPAPTASLSLRVVNDAGEPLPGARVVVARDDVTHAAVCDADGNATLELPRGVTAASIEADGYEPQWQTLTPGTGKPQRVVLSRGLPPAEVKGAVRSLAGGLPLRARVEVVELGKLVETRPDGQFEIGVAPGHYTLRIGADGHETQERTVYVELRGVTILIIDLRRASK